MQATHVGVRASPSQPATASPTLLPLMLGVTLSAFFLRIYNLSFESLNIDEADAVYFAHSDYPTLIGRITQPGENGPLYFLFLRLWTGLAGESEFALRFFSVLPAVLSVPLIFVLGRQLLGTKVGLAAALISTVSTYLLFYAQMVKMYSLVLLLSLLAGLLLLKAVERGSRWSWAGYVVATSAALYTHVFSALLIPWHSLFVLLALRRHQAALVPWLAALAALTLPYLPIGLQRLAALQAPESLNRQITGPQDPLGMLATLAQQYGTLFDRLPPETLSLVFLSLTAGGVATLAIKARADSTKREPLLFLATGILVPLLLTYTLVAQGVPLFASRYLIITLPAFYLLWAAAVTGIASWNKVLGLLILLGFLLLNGARWSQTNINGERFREDWRSAVAYLVQRYAPGDVVVVLHHSSGRAAQYYSASPLLIADLDGGEGQPPDPQQAQVPSSTSKLWLMAAYFEVGDLRPVEAWLDQRSQIVSQTWQPGVMVSQYLVKRPQGELPSRSAPVATIGDGLVLTDLQFSDLPERPDAPLLVTLAWQADAAPLDPYAASMQLTDAHGQVWGRARGPVGGQFYPTERWPQGFSVRDVWEIELERATPSGDYWLSLSIYPRKDQPALVSPAATGAQQALTLGPFTLRRPLHAPP